MSARELSFMRFGIWNGISFGTALAIAISYHANESILWAMVHGFLGWFYVIYYAFAY